MGKSSLKARFATFQNGDLTSGRITIQHQSNQPIYTVNVPSNEVVTVFQNITQQRYFKKLIIIQYININYSKMYKIGNKTEKY